MKGANQDISSRKQVTFSSNIKLFLKQKNFTDKLVAALLFICSKTMRDKECADKFFA